MRRLLVIGLGVALASCATVQKAEVTAEQVDTAAAGAYASAAVAINTYEAGIANPSPTNPDMVKAEALRAQAWTLFTQEHALYKKGIVGSAAAIEAIAAEAARLGK